MFFVSGCHNLVTSVFLCSVTGQLSRPQVTLAKRVCRPTAVETPPLHVDAEAGGHDATHPPEPTPLSDVGSPRDEAHMASSPPERTKEVSLRAPSGDVDPSMTGDASIPLTAAAPEACAGANKAIESQQSVLGSPHHDITPEGTGLGHASPPVPPVAAIQPRPVPEVLFVGEEVAAAPAVGARVTSSRHPGSGDGQNTSKALIWMGLPPVGWGGPQIEWTRQGEVIFKLDDEVDREDRQKLQSRSEAALELIRKVVTLMQSDLISNAVVCCGFCSFYFLLYFGHS